MKLAVLVREQKVSPWLDPPHQLWIVSLEKGKQIYRKQYYLEEPSLSAEVKKLQELGVKILICEAISHQTLAQFRAADIQVIPNIYGMTCISAARN
ncbi:MAG: hypothetical protein ACMUIA_02340 [bacterium]